MIRISIAILKIATLLVGMGALAFLLWEPHLEGRNAHATVFEIYFKDPFLAYAYLASVSFFVALYQAFRFLGYAGQNTAFSPAGIKALRTIRYCAMVMIGFVVAGEIIFILFNDSDDRAGGVFMGILIAFGAIVAGAAATVLEGILQNAMDRIGTGSAV